MGRAAAGLRRLLPKTASYAPVEGRTFVVLSEESATEGIKMVSAYLYLYIDLIKLLHCVKQFMTRVFCHNFFYNLILNVLYRDNDDLDSSN